MKIGYVYKLCCNDLDIKEIYIGSTQAMRNRKSGHKKACNNESDKRHNIKVYQFIRDNGGWDLWDMVLVEKIQYNERCELLARERYYIESLGASLNCYIPGRTNKEYYEKNKERFKEYQIEYKEKNKEILKDKSKQYYQKNKERFKEYQIEYYQNNREKSKEYHREYNEKNKEKLNEYKREYRNKNKEKMNERKRKCYEKNKEKNKEKLNEYKRHWYQRKKILDFIYS